MVSINEVTKAQNILSRYNARVERLEKRIDDAEVAIQEIKTVIEDKKKVIEEYMKEHETIKFPARCTKCGAFGLTNGVLRIRREDGSEAVYCNKCFDKALSEGKKIQIIGTI